MKLCIDEGINSQDNPQLVVNKIGGSFVVSGHVTVVPNISNIIDCSGAALLILQANKLGSKVNFQTGFFKELTRNFEEL